jgi:hypothetical protein
MDQAAYLAKLRALKAANPDLFVARLYSDKDPIPAIQEALEHVDGASAGTNLWRTYMTIITNSLLDPTPR